MEGVRVPTWGPLDWEDASPCVVYQRLGSLDAELTTHTWHVGKMGPGRGSSRPSSACENRPALCMIHLLKAAERSNACTGSQCWKGRMPALLTMPCTLATAVTLMLSGRCLLCSSLDGSCQIVLRTLVLFICTQNMAGCINTCARRRVYHVCHTSTLAGNKRSQMHASTLASKTNRRNANASGTPGTAMHSRRCAWADLWRLLLPRLAEPGMLPLPLDGNPQRRGITCVSTYRG